MNEENTEYLKGYSAAQGHEIQRLHSLLRETMKELARMEMPFPIEIKHPGVPIEGKTCYTEDPVA